MADESQSRETILRSSHRILNISRKMTSFEHRDKRISESIGNIEWVGDCARPPAGSHIYDRPVFLLVDMTQEFFDAIG